MNIHIISGFCHAYLCTNDYPYYFWFTSLKISVRMTINIILVSAGNAVVRTTINILFGFCHAYLCTNDYAYYYRFTSLKISVQMINYIILGFRHAHLCTNDYKCYFWFLPCTYVCKWLFIFLSFRHGHLCTNDYAYLYRDFKFL